jgi:hypothetical protein
MLVRERQGARLLRRGPFRVLDHKGEERRGRGEELEKNIVYKDIYHYICHYAFHIISDSCGGLNRFRWRPYSREFGRLTLLIWPFWEAEVSINSDSTRPQERKTSFNQERKDKTRQE